MVGKRLGMGIGCWVALLAAGWFSAAAPVPVLAQPPGETVPEAAAGEPAGPHVVRNLVYARRGDLALEADLYLPAAEARPYPAVLMVHGGAWITGRKEQMSWQARKAAAMGMAALAINYRLAPKYPFPAQLEDVQAAAAWLVDHGAQYGIDPKRLALFGYSAGGHLACLAATTGDGGWREFLKGVVAGGAPCEFSWIPDDSRQLAYWLGGSRTQVPQTYQRASPLHFATADDPPVFFFHGQSDRLVPLSSPRRMIERLTALGVFCQLYVVPGKGHLLTFLDPGALEQALTFLHQRLFDPADPPGEDRAP